MSPDGVVPGSVAIEDGRITAVGAPGFVGGADVLDARGLYLLPGVIDPEAHMGSNGPLDDDLASETRAAVGTGVTTWNLHQTSHTIFRAAEGRPPPDIPLRFSELVGRFREIGEETSHCDFCLTPLLMRADQAREISALANDWGLTTFKLYMHMRLGREHLAKAWSVAPLLGVNAFDDGLVFEVLREVAALGPAGLVSLHCENWEIARLLESELRAAGRTDMAAWNDRSPGALETMHIHRYAVLARALGCRVHIQHVTTAESAAAVRREREEGTDIYCQTGVHYLVLDAGAWKINVPLRPADEHSGLWRALAGGDVDSVGSDHVGPRRDERTGRIQNRSDMERDSVWDTKSGFASRVEAHLPLLLSEGVNRRRISLQRLAAVTAANPARIWNLYPRKGAIRVGSDADLVLVDLQKRMTLGRDLVLSGSGWTLYEGMDVTGWPVLTVLRGEVAAEWTGSSCWIAPRPRGRFVHRGETPPAAGAA